MVIKIMSNSKKIKKSILLYVYISGSSPVFNKKRKFLNRLN